MEGFVQGIVGGIIPAAVMIVIYFMAMAGRLAKIETNICWLIKELRGCRLRSNDRSP